jgi:dTDP-L-rhamnose 4-epimerase
MTDRILITGGAGFIGSHIADTLLERGHKVVVFDNLTEQVHGGAQRPPDYLSRDVEFVRGDVREYDALAAVLRRVDVVYHKAAAVGVGQSMYQIREYTETNAMGAANLLHFIANEKHTIRKMIVASSMSCYGEGKYAGADGSPVYPRLRPIEQLKNHEWEVKHPQTGEVLTPLPTDESKPFHPTSIYAITKRDHEEMFLAVGTAYQIPAIALRYFNVYGPRQALSNPYTGVGAIFSARLLNGNPPIIYEDGGQSRDFIHVHDVARANALALEAGPEANNEVFNIGAGRAVSIREVAEKLRTYLGREDVPLEFPQKFRAGDIRHCFADISKAGSVLGFEPQVSFDDGVRELAEWVASQQAEDNVNEAAAELERKNLLF